MPLSVKNFSQHPRRWFSSPEGGRLESSTTRELSGAKPGSQPRGGGGVFLRHSTLATWLPSVLSFSSIVYLTGPYSRNHWLAHPTLIPNLLLLLLYRLDLSILAFPLSLAASLPL